ncbi:MAG: response regulator [Armatimonadetes bacterium]|nr:response regulator [Armatimonadota bacterium]
MSKTILIVEDDHIISKALKLNLEIEGYRTLTAYDGEEGLEVARKSLPDLILLDIMLPKMNGFEVYYKLKEDVKAKSIPVIILSGAGREEDLLKGWELGAVDYIVKPFDLNRLLSKVQSVLFPLPAAAAVEARKMPQVLKVAILGANETAVELLRTFLGDPDFRVCGLVDNDSTKREMELARLLDIQTAPDMPALLGKTRADVVLCSTEAGYGEAVSLTPSVEVMGPLAIELLQKLLNTREEKAETNRNLSRKLKKAMEELVIGNEIVNIALAKKESAEVLTEICEYLAGSLDLCACSLLDVDSGGNCLGVVASFGLSENYGNLKTKLGEELCGLSAKIREPLVCFDLSSPALRLEGIQIDRKEGKLLPTRHNVRLPGRSRMDIAAREGARSQISVPLEMDGQLLGVLNGYYSESQYFFEDEAHAFLVIANSVAYALRKLQPRAAPT